MRRTLVLAGVVLLSIAGTLATSAFAQQIRQDPDVLTALLTEVRGLRAAIEQMSSASARVQLAMGRLQLSEQRIATYVRRVGEVRDRRIAAEKDIRPIQAQLDDVMEAVKTNPLVSPQWVEERVRTLKGLIAEAGAGVERLKNEEATLTREIGVEQDRWTEINRTLDDLDRALTRVR
jgi:chromosome segregation ATPase